MNPYSRFDSALSDTQRLLREERCRNRSQRKESSSQSSDSLIINSNMVITHSPRTSRPGSPTGSGGAQTGSISSGTTTVGGQVGLGGSNTPPLVIQVPPPPSTSNMMQIPADFFTKLMQKMDDMVQTQANQQKLIQTLISSASTTQVVPPSNPNPLPSPNSLASQSTVIQIPLALSTANNQQQSVIMPSVQNNPLLPQPQAQANLGQSISVSNPIPGSNASMISSVGLNSNFPQPPQGGQSFTNRPSFLWQTPLPTPTYHGKPSDPGPKQFLRRAKQILMTNNVSETDFIHSWIPSMLLGPAQDWFYGEQPFADWDNFEIKINEAFDRPSNDEYIQDKIAERMQKPQETVCEFIDVMQKLFGQLNTPLSTSEQIRKVKRNLRPEIRAHVERHVYTSLRDFTDHAETTERIEKSKQRQETSRPSSGGNTSTLSSAPKIYPSNSGRSQAPQNNPSHNTCSHCGRIGHPSASCWFKDTASSGQTSFFSKGEYHNPHVKCFNCNKIGHKADFCPDKEKSSYVSKKSGNDVAGNSQGVEKPPASRE